MRKPWGALARVRWLRPRRRSRRRPPWGRLLVGGGVLLVLLAGLTWHLGRAPARELARGVLEERSLARIEAMAPEIRRAAREFRLEPSLIAAVVYVESRGRADAVSSAGALGLMQLMPPSAADAARALGLAEPGREELLADVELNLRLGARHLAWTLEHEGHHIERALCAYNAGRARMRRWMDEHGGYAGWRSKQLADGDSQVLRYALNVLEVQRRFRQRGIF